MLGAVPVGIFGIVADGRIATAFEDDADGVVAALQLAGHVVGVEIDALRVPRKRGLQQLVGRDFGTVEVGTVNAHAADVKPCRRDAVFKVELLAQITRRYAGFAHQNVVLKLMANPFRLPILLVQETDFKWFDFAFHFGFCVPIRYSGNDFPESLVATLEWFATVGNVEHLARFRHARVPKVADVVFGVFGGRGHDDTVVLLDNIIGICGLKVPAEAWCGRGQRH